MTAQREWFDKDYYEVLGVAESATDKEITKAYRKLARQLHPDANPDDPTAEERFKEVSAAYDVLGNDAKRTEYDEVRRLGPMAGGMGGPGFRPPPPGAGGYANGDDLGNLFGNLFNRRGGPQGGGPQRGSDLEASLTLSFTDAVQGLTTTVNLVSDASCRTCNGTGSRPGSAPKICAACGGRGVQEDNQGVFSFSSACGACRGKGVLVVDPCGTCSGTGIETRSRDVKVRLPAGVDDGQTIKLKGRGGPGRNGGPAGDLFVKVRVQPDRLFGRSGKHLTLTVPVTFPEAVLGAKVRVPTLDGDPVTIKVPAGTSPGKVLRVRGRGVESAKGTGDLLVTIDVVVPDELTDGQRAAVEALAEASDATPRAHLGVEP